MTGAREVRRLITHDGRFHADEVLATAVLTRLFPEAEVVRTRDQGLVQDPFSPDIIYDVGGVYEPARRRFDHHQPGAPTRPNGDPYSAFGLIWARYAAPYLRQIGTDPSLIDRVAASVDESLVRGIDLLDNGRLDPAQLGAAADLTLPMLIEDLNPAFDDPSPEAERSGFDAAVRLAATLLENRALSAEATLRADREVRGAIDASWGSPILELPRGAPFGETISRSGADHIRLVVHPRKTDWVVSTVSVTPGSFVRRLDLPEAWAGLEGEALSEASGVGGAVFCHRARFMAVARTREGALRMAELALAPDPVPEPS
ncbi:uncharacterized UPF0160 family protein [Gemmobacter caeni]|uniref:Uncharacterized UPF0160 family protein n=1 Tax=Gemmobacter caeni TaxID=589035 RepID=A0A2T6B8C7_9RHOB|nr:MYG1 family protein [Gemmobacter caeni]PTX52282.1 uncharacterized UPF0160 family protein [Gemmobacter caeni]TWJ02655.1 uncharacterized UPF0160 family protein [Gemmobacter caeni]